VSAYSASRIVTARKTHDCDRCDELIATGTRYLRYELSHGISYGLHLQCAQLRSENGTLAYDCNALRLELGLPLRSAT
jgi:hypothetical protein